MNGIYFRCMSVLLLAIMLSYGGQQLIEYRAEAAITGHYLDNTFTGTVHFPTYGLQCSFPVGVDNTLLVFAAEYGTIPRSVKIPESTDIIFSSVALRYTFLRLKELISLSASVSLNNCAMHLMPSGNMSDFVIIATWENEFGTGAGIDVGVDLKWFTISVPLHAAVFFTGKPTYVYSGGLRMGMLFKKHRDVAR
ncbi:MAG TPA: hypothetical protein VHO70_10510 [Chitinispirillaceae bacterium]|nr:hypothetical protein [Chitinispirillaceae bacterium]